MAVIVVAVGGFGCTPITSLFGHVRVPAIRKLHESGQPTKFTLLLPELRYLPENGSNPARLEVGPGLARRPEWGSRPDKLRFREAGAGFSKSMSAALRSAPAEVVAALGHLPTRPEKGWPVESRQAIALHLDPLAANTGLQWVVARIVELLPAEATMVLPVVRRAPDQRGEWVVLIRGDRIAGVATAVNAQVYRSWPERAAIWKPTVPPDTAEDAAEMLERLQPYSIRDRLIYAFAEPLEAPSEADRVALDRWCREPVGEPK